MTSNPTVLVAIVSAGIAAAGFSSTCIVLAVKHAHRQGELEGRQLSFVRQEECTLKHEKVDLELKEGAICMTELNGKIETLTQLTKRQDAAVDRFERLLEKNGG